MNIPNRAQRILSLDDPRVAPFRGLRERDLRAQGLFVAEGALLTQRLLASRFPAESILMSEGSQPQLQALERLDEARQPNLYVAEPALLRQIVGFDFHRGVLGLGRRLPLFGVRELVEPLAETSPSLRLLACPGTESSENLGLMARSARAFGAHALLLPRDGADFLSRRCLRQSMGGALFLPAAASDSSASLLEELIELRRSLGLELVASVAPSPEDGVTLLPDFVWPERSVLVVGNEFHGLDEAWTAACDARVTIPIEPGCDSLNAAVATGILLHAMRAAHPA